MTKEFRKIYRNIGNLNFLIFIIIAISVLFVKPSWCSNFEADPKLKHVSVVKTALIRKTSALLSKPKETKWSTSGLTSVYSTYKGSRSWCGPVWGS